MTWAQRAKAGIDAKHFQVALERKAKSYSKALDSPSTTCAVIVQSTKH